MTRIDYYNDPDAPAANSLVVAASAVVADRRERILLQRRGDNGLWALPGGGTELGESIADTVVRETHEETGIEVEPQYVIGVYSDPRHVFEYSNGEVRQEFSVCVACVAKTEAIRLPVTNEATDADFFAPRNIEKLDMHPRIRLRINDYLNGTKAALR
jgi:8-oxo-dGTP pyrophosphatase MutT (NUDIX family)